MQFQRELSKPVPKFPQEPLSVRTALEPHNEVVGIPNEDDLSARMPPPPLLGPEVEDVMQEEVGQER